MMIHEVSLAEEIRLIVRGDDFGMTQGSLIAFEKAFDEGVLTCWSVLVPAPWFEGAAELKIVLSPEVKRIISEKAIKLTHSGKSIW